ncbi:MAG: alanine--tRNA ligase [Ferrimicrobium sp.]
MDSDGLRHAFVDFFTSRGHVHVPSASLIPFDQTLLFTVAGMVPFKPYFLGEEVAPYSRATSIQRCMRAGGKHNDLDQIGKTLRHLTFFEMMGNFSFGDYFKETAIPLAWELVTQVLGLDPELLWVTVHTSDDEAAALWVDSVGVSPERIQRMDEDNWWQMGDTGPCGPCSEIYYDKGARYGAEGGPAFGGDDRFLEIWNLVFMQYERHDDGELSSLPRPCIDTGAGLERIVPLLQGRPSVFETDLMLPILEEAQSRTGRAYGQDAAHDIGLRIIADHARASSFLISDGIVPSNEGRGYVLRRIIRRLVLRASLLGAAEPVMVPLVDAVVAAMGTSYPALVEGRDAIAEIVEREEARFQTTLRNGYQVLSEEFDTGAVSGDVAFRLHDTFGFPIELTTEIAQERGIPVDMVGFDAEMSVQRARARAAGLGGEVVGGDIASANAVLERFGVTDFSGYESMRDSSTVHAVIDDGDWLAIYLERSCFYPEGGGQVGDTGEIVAPAGRARVFDTDRIAGGLIRHKVQMLSGVITAGDVVDLVVDEERRSRIRANHTATHLLHWALRSVLGDHVRQQGSLVEPDRLRFDFTHWRGVTRDEIDQVEALILGEILADLAVTTEILPKEEALAAGAIAFFGDRYQDEVRVVHAGSESLELCGGTHLDRVGRIGFVHVVQESSIGSNTRRIEAVTQRDALAAVHADAHQLREAARLLQVSPGDLAVRVESILERQRVLEAEVQRSQSTLLRVRALELISTARDATVVARVEGVQGSQLRELALFVREQVKVVVLAGVSDAKVALVAAVHPEVGISASELLGPVASAVGGGVGRGQDLAMSGGTRLEALDDALVGLREDLRSRWRG